MDIQVGQVLRHVQTSEIKVLITNIGNHIVKVKVITPIESKDKQIALRRNRVYRSWVRDPIAEVLYGFNTK